MAGTAGTACTAAAPARETAADSTAITELGNRYAAAFNSGDAAALAALADRLDQGDHIVPRNLQQPAVFVAHGPTPLVLRIQLSGGGGSRTHDLRVMSPAS